MRTVTVDALANDVCAGVEQLSLNARLVELLHTELHQGRSHHRLGPWGRGGRPVGCRLAGVCYGCVLGSW